MAAFVIPAVAEQRYDTIVWRTLNVILPFKGKVNGADVEDTGRLIASYSLVDANGNTTSDASFVIDTSNADSQDFNTIVMASTPYQQLIATIDGILKPFAETKAAEKFPDPS